MPPTRHGLEWQQVEAVRTGMSVRQEAILGVPAQRQLGLTGIDLHGGAVLLIPSQPPPPVPSMRRGNERDVTAGMSGHQLTIEATPVRLGVPGDRRPYQ